MSMMNAGAVRRRSDGGYALLEALVAVVVLSIGFIGAARMQTVGIKLNNSAQSRQKANLLVYQMTDRIRSNLQGFADGNYNNVAVGSAACLSVGCTPAELAIADMTEWSADLAAQLPSGTGAVCVDSTPDDGIAGAPGCDGIGFKLAVKVFWTDTVASSRFVTVLRP